MTSDVTQAALESCPNPWCNSRKTVDCEIRAAEAPILMPSRSSAEWAVACPVCPLQTPYFDTEVEAIAAWNTRPTAQSGEGRSGAGEDALLEHFTRMMEAAANYVEPTTYVARHPNVDALGACKYNTEFPEPEESHAEEAKQAIRQRRDQAFIRDMIYMLDGPEQRAALNARQSGDGERE